jgi:RHS repeat-associated protein
VFTSVVDPITGNRVAGVAIARYKYDALGRRILKRLLNPDGTTQLVTRFYYDGDRVVEERQGGQNLPVRQYIWGNYVDELLISDQVDAMGNYVPAARLYALQNSTYSVHALVNDAGAVVEKCSYTPYGEVSIQNALGQVLPVSAVGNNYLFTGRELDAETGLFYFRARTYAPKLGRFIQRDTQFRDGMNLYEFGRSRPTGAVDPSGEFVLAESYAAAEQLRGLFLENGVLVVIIALPRGTVSGAPFPEGLLTSQRWVLLAIGITNVEALVKNREMINRFNRVLTKTGEEPASRLVDPVNWPPNQVFHGGTFRRTALHQKERDFLATIVPNMFPPARKPRDVMKEGIAQLRAESAQFVEDNPYLPGAGAFAAARNAAVSLAVGDIPQASSDLREVGTGILVEVATGKVIEKGAGALGRGLGALGAAVGLGVRWSRTEIALGLTQHPATGRVIIQDFAKNVGGASYWERWAVDGFITSAEKTAETQFRVASAKAARIHFSLEGFPQRADVTYNIARTMPWEAGRGQITYNEFRAILHDAELLKKTVFYEHGAARTGKEMLERVLKHVQDATDKSRLERVLKALGG